MSEGGGRTWLITGADKGLGRSLAETALARGDNVVVTVLASDGGHPLTQAYPDRFRSIHLDALHHHRVPEVAREAEAAFGRIDVLVNNAGYGLISLAEETPPEVYRHCLEVNFFATVEMTRAVLPVMRRQRSGHVINLSSIAGFGVGPGFAYYGAAKFAVEGFSEALHHEVGPLGIKVTILEPAGFRSDFAGASLRTVATSNPDYAAAGKYIAEYSATRHGTQNNDPARFGPALCRLVDADDPPLRLPLGVDAVRHVRNEMAKVEAELVRWEDLAFSTTDRT